MSLPPDCNNDKASKKTCDFSRNYSTVKLIREADNSLQRTEAMSSTCPLIEDSTVN